MRESARAVPRLARASPTGSPPAASDIPDVLRDAGGYARSGRDLPEAGAGTAGAAAFTLADFEERGIYEPSMHVDPRRALPGGHRRGRGGTTRTGGER